MYGALDGSEDNPKYKNFLDFEDAVIEVLTQFRETDGVQQSGSKMDTEVVQPRATKNSHVFGISNIGNTCFFNSTMQAMNATRELVQEYIENKDDFEEHKTQTASRFC